MAQDNKTFVWKTIFKPTIYRIKGKKCEICGSTNNLDLHHTDYKEVNLNTIRVLCRKCHKSIHKKMVTKKRLIGFKE